MIDGKYHILMFIINCFGECMFSGLIRKEAMVLDTCGRPSEKEKMCKALSCEQQCKRNIILGPLFLVLGLGLWAE